VIRPKCAAKKTQETLNSLIVSKVFVSFCRINASLVGHK
jgi:hypothetical protein